MMDISLGGSSVGLLCTVIAVHVAGIPGHAALTMPSIYGSSTPTEVAFGRRLKLMPLKVPRE